MLRGKVDREDFELLLMAIGYNLSSKELESCMMDMGVDPSGGTVSFELFFDWWTDSAGVNAMRKRTSKK